MKRLTVGERRFVDALVRANIRLLFNRARKNTGRFIPTRITIEPSEATRMVRVVIGFRWRPGPGFGNRRGSAGARCTLRDRRAAPRRSG